MKTEKENVVASASDLHKTYPEHGYGKNKTKKTLALRGVNISVNEGEIFGIIGENGAGKSTLIECLTGSRIPSSGSVSLLNTNPVGLNAKQKKNLFNQVGVQFQTTAFQQKIKVMEECISTASMYENPADWKKLLTDFDLIEKSQQYVTELSGGQKQKLAVILALIPQPKLVFLDELTTGLDPKSRHKIWDYLKKLQKDGLTIILTSHYMEEVEYLCDRIAILKNGKIEALGTPASLIAKHNTKNLEETFLMYMEKDGE